MNILEGLEDDDDANWNRSTLYLQINNYGLSDSSVLWIDTDSVNNTKWKYIKGKQKYTKWYTCDGILNNSYTLVGNISIDIR